MGKSLTRQHQILSMLKDIDEVRVGELSKFLGVSESTIRRDLNKLASSRQLLRNHGGAELFEAGQPEPPVLIRLQENLSEKQRIGKTAAGLINPEETVFIGSGTTALEVARNLSGRHDITVITNAQTVTNLLSPEEGIELISTGGLLRHSEQSYLGHIAVQALQQLRINKVIMGIRSITIRDGLTSNYLPEVTTDQAIIQSASEVILVADHTKFGKVSTAFVAPITALSTIVTDDKTNLETIEEIRALGIHVIVV